MEIEIELTSKDYQEAIYLHQGKIFPARNPVVVQVIVILVLLLNLGVCIQVNDPNIIIIAISFLLLIGGYLLYHNVFIPYRIRKIFEQQKELSEPFIIEIGEDIIKVSSASGYSERPISDFHKWKENKSLFLIYQSDVLFNIIPKRFLTNPEQEEYIREQLTQHVKLAKGRWYVYVLITLFILASIIFVLCSGMQSFYQ
jgi:hypothetical protein